MKLEFDTNTFADIFTAYLAESDLLLINNEEAPGFLAKRYSFSLFEVPRKNVAGDQDQFAFAAHDFCFSKRFIEIMLELSDQGIQYVRFNADGPVAGEVEGMEYWKKETDQVPSSRTCAII